ncbi:MAG: helix-turn-helix transcriptional regulator [Lachnospiraceae bacterium]|nr:helix-turn-helix transcriptional regulator [Lachnospiraceae bacterium]
MIKNKTIFYVSKTYKRFLISFLIVLFLPVLCFVYLFQQNFRNIYRERIVEQAQISLETAGRELERDISILQSIVVYNSMGTQFSKRAILEDLHAKTITKILAAEFVTHPLLENIYYYNEVRPELVYSPQGTYSPEYFERIYVDAEGRKQLPVILESITDKKWLIWKDGKASRDASVQYVVRANLDAWWIFHISNEQLNQIFSSKDAVTLLINGDGEQIYTSGDLADVDYYEISFTSSEGDFQVIRYIDQKSLFAELNKCQRYFFIIVMIVLLLGGGLILVMTYYNELPIKAFIVFCKEKFQNVPSELGWSETFQFAMKSMDEQLILQERNHRRNRLLMHLLYAADNDILHMEHRLREENLFRNAECYRVILITAEGGNNAELNKMGLFLNMLKKEEYEFYLIDLEPKEALVMIAGMSEKAEKKLENELNRISNIIEANVNEKLFFYVGGKCSEIEQIHDSYSQALLCKQNERECQKNGSLFLYSYVKNDHKKDKYPSDELNQLFEALIDVELEKVVLITDELVKRLENYNDNRFAKVSLYYDILNIYYKAQIQMESDMEIGFLEADLLDLKENLDAVQMIYRIREQYQEYVEEIHEKAFEKDCDLIDKVIHFIDENRTSPEMCVNMVAEHFGMSISHMSHKFKEKTNTNISNYITEKRIAYACELLIETDYSIKDIALMVGYSHPVSLIRRIKQLHGMTPLEYREKYKNSSKGK